jgi:hypothetical protein
MRPNCFQYVRPLPLRKTNWRPLSANNTLRASSEAHMLHLQCGHDTASGWRDYRICGENGEAFAYCLNAGHKHVPRNARHKWRPEAASRPTRETDGSRTSSIPRSAYGAGKRKDREGGASRSWPRQYHNCAARFAPCLKFGSRRSRCSG